MARNNHGASNRQFAGGVGGSGTAAGITTPDFDVAFDPGQLSVSSVDYCENRQETAGRQSF